jgi:hypothetical protein
VVGEEDRCGIVVEIFQIRTGDDGEGEGERSLLKTNA